MAFFRHNTVENLSKSTPIFSSNEVLSSSPVGCDRWCIMSLAMKVGGLEVV
jgi:hypothetical protein